MSNGGVTRARVKRAFANQDGEHVAYVQLDMGGRNDDGLVHVTGPRPFEVGQSVTIERDGLGWRLAERR